MLSTNKLLKHAVKIIASFACFLFLTTVNAQTVDCPADTNLGTIDCNSIQDLPAQVNTIAAAMEVYGIEINDPLPETGVVTTDSDIVFYCESDAREVTREVIIYNDQNFNFSYDPGEEITTCTFTITTEPDIVAPVFEAPTDTTTTCILGIDPIITGMPILSSDSCPDLTGDNVNFSDAPPTIGACAGEKIYVRSWTATDPCGNANDPQTQIITVLDLTGPEFTVPADINVPCGTDPADASITGDVTDGFDECEGIDVIVQGRIVTTETQEDTPCPGYTTYVKRWGAIDGCGNANTKDQIIVVECPADCTNQDPCEGDIVTDPPAGECGCTIVEPQVLGCTDPTSANYNAAANCDDDSCGNFDLALLKELSSAGPFSPGGDVTFSITVFNQGDFIAQNIEITDYAPAGLTLNDSNWVDAGNGTATTIIAGPLAPGDSESVDITFTIPADAGPGSFENFAEISAAEDENGNPATDIDSTPDNDPDNDTYTDGITDNTDGDEDDHDGAIFEIACIDGCMETAACNFNPNATCDDGTCMAVPTCNADPCVGDVTELSADTCSCDLVEEQVLGCTDAASSNYDAAANCDNGSCGNFDLALLKELSSAGPFSPGGDITFTITVFNQGAFVAQNIEITDYAPTGFTLNDSNWVDAGNGTSTTIIAGPLAAGASESVDITFTIPTNAGPGSLENFAEISSAEDENGNPATDIDSTPDNDPDNDNYTDGVTDNTGGDEDDHDGVTFEIACINGCMEAAACNFNPNATCDDGTCMAVPTCNADPCVGDVTELSADTCSCDVIEEQVLGCTDAASSNYDAAANCDNGSCGNFDLALLKELSSAGPFSPGGDITFTITVFNQGAFIAQNIEITDYTPTGFTLNDNNWVDAGNGTATTIITGPLGPGDSESVDITFTIPTNAGPGSLENFAEISSAEDENGNPATDIDSTPDNDPDNDNYTDGVTDNTDGDEDDHDGVTFEIACINGCMEAAACNFNPNATCDDGTCMAVPTCNADPCAGDVTELSADGCTCELVTPQVLGCTDAAACNYNSNANCDDGSCIAVPTCNVDPCVGDITQLSADGCTCELVTPQVLGCTNVSSCNYNANANCEDGSCLSAPVCNTNPCRGDIEKVEGCNCVVLEPQVLGCNDPLAENYDAIANCNDGSCIYPSPCPPKMRVCTAPLTPIDICLPCILSGELDAEITDVNTLFAQCEIDGLDDENTACLTYIPLPLAQSPSEIEITYCTPSTGQCWTIIVIIDINPDCSDTTICPDVLNLCTTPTVNFATAAPLEICFECIEDGSFPAEIVDVGSLFYCSIDDLDDDNGACFKYTPVPLMELYSPEQLTVEYCIPGTNDCHTTVINIEIKDDCGDTTPVCAVDGGTLTGGPFDFCVGDGIPDFAAGVSLSGNTGASSQWVVTDSDNNVLDLIAADALVDFNFDGAGSGSCLIWNISYDAVSGLAEGANANNFTGCYDLSNPITVNRIECTPTCSARAAAISGGPFSFCVSDGTADFVSGITVTGGVGGNSGWVITDEQGNILGLPDMPGSVDFDSTDFGTCLIWYINYDELDGLVVDENVSDLAGCYTLSNSIEVVREECVPVCNAASATISGGPFSFCVEDGTSDFVSGITVSGGAGSNSAWVITDDQLNILVLPDMPGSVDFDDAGFGTCLIWYVSYDELGGAVVGENAANLTGCFELSNSIEVVREECEPVCNATSATISGGPFSFCVADGTPDFVSGITVSGGTGANSGWVVTDANSNILGLPAMPGSVDFDGAGFGNCLIWYVSYDELDGAVVGENAANLTGCFALSNSIQVVREDCTPEPSDCSATLQFCTLPVTEIEVCIPCIADGSLDAEITSVISLFGCSIEDLDDANGGCFSYTPLPLLQNYSPDILTVEYCQPDGTCATTEIVMEIKLDCGVLVAPQNLDEALMPQPFDILEEQIQVEGENVSDKNNSLEDAAEIFPVPSSGAIYVKINEEMKDAAISIYNIAGQIMETEALSSDRLDGYTHIFDIRTYENGVYFLVAKKGDKIQTGEFVKQ